MKFPTVPSEEELSTPVPFATDAIVLTLNGGLKLVFFERISFITPLNETKEIAHVRGGVFLTDASVIGLYQLLGRNLEGRQSGDLPKPTVISTQTRN